MNLNDKISWLENFYAHKQIKKLSAESINELYELTQPKKVCIETLQGKNMSNILVNSEDGYVKIHKWRNKGIKSCFKVVTNSYDLEGSNDHFVELSNGKWKSLEYLTDADILQTITGPEKITHIEKTGNKVVYDFHINHENHRYYTNGISSHNSGAGKSLFLQNLAVNWTELGLNGAYITLELSEDLCAMRLDSMMTSIPTKNIFKNIDDVELQVKTKAKKAGKFRIKYMPAQSTINDLRAYVRELKIQTGVKLDFLCVDYLDLLMPSGVKVNSSDFFTKDKYVSEELRNLAKELGVYMVSASQLNRSAVEEVEFDHSMISGGISKIYTSDNVFGIFTSRAMRERGKYQLQLMKTRSSSGVGSKIDLDFDVETLRITDSGNIDMSTGEIKKTNILDSIKTRSTVHESPKVSATVESSKLNSLLNKIKNDQ